MRASPREGLTSGFFLALFKRKDGEEGKKGKADEDDGEMAKKRKRKKRKKRKRKHDQSVPVINNVEKTKRRKKVDVEENNAITEAKEH